MTGKTFLSVQIVTKHHEVLTFEDLGELVLEATSKVTASVASCPYPNKAADSIFNENSLEPNSLVVA